MQSNGHLFRGAVVAMKMPACWPDAGIRHCLYPHGMAVWLVAEDRVQIVRADRVITFTVTHDRDFPNESNPVKRIGHGQVRILAGTQTARDANAVSWTTLLSFDGDGKAVVKVLQDLAVTLDQAEARARGEATVFVHGPLPRLSGNPRATNVWSVSNELPVKDWPTSGSFWRAPAP